MEIGIAQMKPRIAQMEPRQMVSRFAQLEPRRDQKQRLKPQKVAWNYPHETKKMPKWSLELPKANLKLTK